MVTDKLGKSNAVFYAADTPTTYTVLVQGIDLTGSVGSTVVKIVAKK